MFVQKNQIGEEVQLLKGIENLSARLSLILGFIFKVRLLKWAVTICPKLSAHMITSVFVIGQHGTQKKKPLGR